MAVVAGVAARNVGWMFASGNNTIVAGSAGTDDLRVVNGENGRKEVGCVAVLTNIAGLNVVQVLANCIGPVVAACATAGNADVVEIRG